MRCTRPIRAGYDNNGDVVYSKAKASKELVGFEFECRKCLPCRLNIAREKAIRCFHEAKMHENNIFLTLTYNDENLKSPKLNYLDFQLFMKSLRESVTRGITDKELREKKYISYMVTGEYGETNKRPHWHALLFNYAPRDQKKKYTTDLGDQVWTSETLTRLWGKGNVEYGSVTMDSAGYVARYAAKKLIHGKDEEHDYHPIHKTSSKRAIGRSWIEANSDFTFNMGYVNLPNGQVSKIPRYYVDWLKKYHFEKYLRYIKDVRPKIIFLAEKKARKDEMDYLSEIMSYKGGAGFPLTRSKVEETILKSKFKQLQEKLKL